MIYAHVTNGTIDAVGQPPLLYHDGTRWWDLRTRDAALLASLGWLPVTETPRPADTATTTYDYSVELVGGVPVETWTERPKTQAELDADAQEANRRTVEESLDLRMATMQAIIDDTNANINTNPAARIKDIARAVRLLIREARGDFDGTT